MFDQKIIENLGELLQKNRFSQNYYVPGPSNHCGLPVWFQIEGDAVEIPDYEGRDLFVTQILTSHSEKPFSLFDGLTGENLSIGNSKEDTVARMAIYSNPIHQTGKTLKYQYDITAAIDMLENVALLSPRYADFSSSETHRVRIEYVKDNANFPFECKQFVIDLLADHPGIHWCLNSSTDNEIWVYASQDQRDYEHKRKFDRTAETQTLATVIQSKKNPACISCVVTFNSVGVLGVKVIIDTDILAENIVAIADQISNW